MKRKLGISILLLFVAFNLFAQRRGRGFDGGVLLGVVPSQVDGDSYSGYHKIGVEAGVFSSFKFSKEMALQVEIKYIQKGAKQVSKDNAFFYKSSLQYVEVPFSLQYLYKKNIIIEGGVALGYLFKATEDFGYGPLEPVPDFESYEFSGFIGAGYKISEHFYILNRFSYSILPVRMYPKEIQTIKDRGWNNNIIIVSLYYKFL